MNIRIMYYYVKENLKSQSEHIRPGNLHKAKIALGYYSQKALILYPTF